jgi:MobA/MobL family
LAIFHLSVKAISRSDGRSATAAAAYRAGCKITDERTGNVHDYTRKTGIQSTDIVLPDGSPEWAKDREKLWNAAELAEKRKDACVAREYEVALPCELSPEQRRFLALEFAKDMANREGCAVDVAIHAPDKEGDNRNYHAHILRTTRKVGPHGLGDKLDTEKAGRKRTEDLQAVRVAWANLVNEHLDVRGFPANVDHRSLKAQGIDREPTKHRGPTATTYERWTGLPSDKRLEHQKEANERLLQAKRLGELERFKEENGRAIIDLSNDIEAARRERDAAQAKEAQRAMARIEAANERERRLEAIKWAPDRPNGNDPGDAYKTFFKFAVASFGMPPDMSEADYRLAAVMMKSGAFSPEQIAETLERYSPEVPIRRAREDADYVEKIMNTVKNDPVVIQERRQSIALLESGMAEMQRRNASQPAAPTPAPPRRGPRM